MSKAMVTFGIGAAFEGMLEIAMPSFQAFADKHGWELLVPVPEAGDRPPSWQKIPEMIAALDSGYSEVLWVDADAVVVDTSEDLSVPAHYWQALVVHRTGDGEVPSAGFWLVRPPMLVVLEHIWTMTQWLHDGWWEQAALIELMGYQRRPCQRVRESELYNLTYILDNGWGVHRNDTTPYERARVQHASMWPDRAAVMRQWAADAAAGWAKPVRAGKE